MQCQQHVDGVLSSSVFVHFAHFRLILSVTGFVSCRVYAILHHSDFKLIQSLSKDVSFM